MKSSDRLRMDARIAAEKRRREESGTPIRGPYKRPSPMPDAFPDYPVADSGPTDFVSPKEKT